MLRQNPVSYENLMLEQLLKPSIPYKSTLFDSCQEAGAMLFLHAIGMMPQKIFGLSPMLVLKFKALLKIIAFNFMIRIKEWADKEFTFTCAFLDKIAEELSSLIPNANRIYREEQYSRLINHFKNFLKLKAFIFSSDFFFDENKFDIGITNIAAEFQVNHHNSEETKQRIFFLLSNIVYTMEIEGIRKSFKKFDLTTLNPTIDRNRNLNVAELCAEFGLQNTANTLKQLNDKYISVHLDFEAFLDTVISRMDNSFLVDKKILSALYQDAFANFHNNNTAYFKHSAIQLYLQQLRKPELRSEIFSLLSNYHFPAMTNYYKSLGKDKTIDLNRMSHWTNRIDSDSPLLLSLHQVLNTSYRQLLSPYIANCYEDEDYHDVTPVLSTSVDHSMLPEQLFTGFNPGEEVRPLFIGEVPGKILKENIELLNYYNVELSQYQKALDILYQRADISIEDCRAEAVKLFEIYLKKATNVHEIAALIEVAEPYINIHQRPIFDENYGIKITKTWGKMLKLARDEGMKFLKKEVTSAKDKNDKIVGLAALNYWRRNNLFAQHRSNFKITGAFGRTDAQVEIDNMRKSIRKSIM